MLKNYFYIAVAVLVMLSSCRSAQIQDGPVIVRQITEIPNVYIQLHRNGSQVDVEIDNKSLYSVCIYRTQWVDGNEHLIKVRSARGNVPFTGYLPSNIGRPGERPIVILPGRTISAHLELREYFQTSTWVGVDISYDPVLSVCEQ